MLSLALQILFGSGFSIGVKAASVRKRDMVYAGGLNYIFAALLCGAWLAARRRQSRRRMRRARRLMNILMRSPLTIRMARLLLRLFIQTPRALKARRPLLRQAKRSTCRLHTPTLRRRTKPCLKWSTVSPN